MNRRRTRPARIVLVRHAPAEHRDPRRWPDDDDRPLRRDGARSFARAALGIAHLLERHGAAATSPLRRARQTVDLLGAAWRPARSPDVWTELRPEATGVALLAKASRAIPRSGGELVLVGHEPQLSRVVGLAVTGESASVVRFSKGGAVALDFATSVVPGGGKIAWSITRTQLERLATGRAVRERERPE